MKDLISSQELREKACSEELERMGEHIHRLTASFYEKVELPINTAYSSIRQEVARLQQHLASLLADPSVHPLL
jgi:uncharacterized protein with HEPN domain